MTNRPSNSCVILGVTGSIAACKAADLASRLTKAGVDTHVVMTDSATRLVQPRTFQTLTRNPVVTDLWDLPDWQPGHIALADRADLLIVAPATANILAKMAHGIADDALSTQILAHEGPVAAAPAMNPRMWRHPAVRENVNILRRRGVRILGPACGDVACGAPGEGRMLEPESIAQAVKAQLLVLRTPQLAGRHDRVLVTAGPTCEDVDPVRFLTNRSSGRMGYAVAAAAAAAGMSVTLVTGPTALPLPLGCTPVHVRSAADMADAVKKHLPHVEGLIMAAAVADYRPETTSAAKIVKSAGPLSLPLQRTEDILATVAEIRQPRQWIVGFAAETEHAEERAKEKLARKRLDWIAVNDVARSDIGFDSAENELVLHSPTTRIELGKADKLELAVRLLAAVVPEHTPENLHR
ncbi:MAG: bifunctional phosphopantothenoylcysteine decarboxylase/phosphopantothenate--cysteine ligase CoaBC [Verrucomicrobiota bacterium]